VSTQVRSPVLIGMANSDWSRVSWQPGYWNKPDGAVVEVLNKAASVGGLIVQTGCLLEIFPSEPHQDASLKANQAEYCSEMKHNGVELLFRHAKRSPVLL
jgi:hypothetical protein